MCVAKLHGYGLCHALQLYKRKTIIYKNGGIAVANVVYIKTGITKGRVTLGIEHDGECHGYSVSLTTYSEIGSPIKFSHIDEHLLADIAYEDECFRAMKKAVSLLAISDKSRHTLEGKLIMSGFSKEAAKEAVCECLSLGYIDEERQLDRLCEREANISLKGSLMIKRKLMSKGYRASDIESALERLTDKGVIDFCENFKRLCEKKLVQTEEEERQLRFKYGYYEGDC